VRQQKRNISAKDITNDIRSGMTDSDLMDKYRLSAKGLQSVFKKLEDLNAISASELCGRSPGYDDTVRVDDVRKELRQNLEVLLPICEVDCPQIKGTVRDISSQGVGIKGIQTSVGETKTFEINPGRIFPVDPFGFQAVCRWVAREGTEKDYVAGFEIVSISEESLENLRKLIVDSSGICLLVD
jgi:hypothetical protein